MSQIVLKCRLCRAELLQSLTSPILTAHNSLLSTDSVHHISSDDDCRDITDSLYLEEYGLPEWVLPEINEAGWKKGKVKCPKCSSRLGSFDFISGRKCNCNQFVLPPVHIIRGKVDYKIVEIKH